MLFTTIFVALVGMVAASSVPTTFETHTISLPAYGGYGMGTGAVPNATTTPEFTTRMPIPVSATVTLTTVLEEYIKPTLVLDARGVMEKRACSKVVLIGGQAPITKTRCDQPPKTCVPCVGCNAPQC